MVGGSSLCDYIDNQAPDPWIEDFMIFNLDIDLDNKVCQVDYIHLEADLGYIY